LAAEITTHREPKKPIAYIIRTINVAKNPEINYYYFFLCLKKAQEAPDSGSRIRDTAANLGFLENEIKLPELQLTTGYRKQTSKQPRFYQYHDINGSLLNSDRYGKEKVPYRVQ
jgi:hypothetical protein